MEGVRVLLLAGSIAATLVGGLYGGAELTFDDPPTVEPTREETPLEEVAVAEVSVADSFAEVAVADSFAEVPDVAEETDDTREGRANADVEPDEIPLTNGLRIGPMTVAVVADEVFSNAQDIPLSNGLRIGPMELHWGGEEEADEEASTASSETPAKTIRRVRRRVRPPVTPPGPRLHANAGIHTVMTARRMIARNERIRGSCYRYLSEVFARAGHDGWRRRRILHRSSRDGPYADLSVVRPGDWLYIVNDPHRTPVGTHSVMFVGWRDRARGIANVISHPGWGSPRSGRERSYDISRTYRIIRPVS